jgi:predicted RNA polymerase sigma factor
LIPLADQDRSRWDQQQIKDGIELISAALTKGRVGEYQIQAAIAAVHDEAARPEDTDWRQILELYGLLERITRNPMVTLNRAVAAAMVDGPAAGLAMLRDLDGPLRGHHRIDAVRGHLHEMLGERAAAVDHYRAAAGRTTSIAERNYLATKAARLTSPER